MKTATLSMRVDPEVKDEAEQIFSSLGLTTTQAINIFLHKTILEGGIPFQVAQPRYNPETEAALQEAADIIAGRVQAKRYSDVDSMLADIENDAA